MKAALQSFSPFKSCGTDDLKPIVFNNLGPNAITFIAKAMQVSYSLGYIPRTWHETMAIFIPKPAKADYGLAGSFRPISLMQFMFKTAERVIMWDILDKESRLEVKPPSQWQHAYRSDKGTDTAIAEQVDLIESAIYREKYALVVSMDMQGAFDNLKTESIVRGMKNKLYPQKTITWYRNFLENRNVSAELLGGKCTLCPKCGTP